MSLHFIKSLNRFSRHLLFLMVTQYISEIDRGGKINAQETTPLLTKKNVQPVTYAKEMYIIAKTSVPVIFAYMLQNSLQTACVLIVGRMVCLNFLVPQRLIFHNFNPLK